MWALDQALPVLVLVQVLVLVLVLVLPAQRRVPQRMQPTVALRLPALPLLVLVLVLVQALLVPELLVPAPRERAKAILLPPQLPVRGQLLTPEPAPKSFILTTTAARSSLKGRNWSTPMRAF